VNPISSHALRSATVAGCLWLLAGSTASAIFDSNENGVSDVWEKLYNAGSLIPDLDPMADSDGDGWTDGVEAVAGTNPFDGTAPGGFVRPDIVHFPAVYTTGPDDEIILASPEAVTITWPTIAGKMYALQASTDLTEQVVGRR
jgi:hypothetical protein